MVYGWRILVYAGRSAISAFYEEEMTVDALLIGIFLAAALVIVFISL
jgi:hypothetical protein